MKKRTRITAVFMLACLLFGLSQLSARGASADYLPKPAVTIDYDISADLATLKTGGGAGTALLAGQTYYVAANATDYQAGKNSLVAAAPGSAYWQIAVDGSGVRTPSLYLAGQQLVEVKDGVTVDIRASNAAEIVMPNPLVTTKYDIKTLQNSVPEDVNQTSGHLAILQGDVYNTLTGKGWAVAVANVQPASEAPRDWRYYSNFTNALAAANRAALSKTARLLLLADTAIASKQEVNANLSVIYCNSKQLTVTAGGQLTLNSAVLTNNSADLGVLLLKNGGKIVDNAANQIKASYDENMLPGGKHPMSQVTGNGTGTTLIYDAVTQTAPPYHSVEIKGEFAKVNGYFALMGHTTIQSTTGSTDNPQSSAYIVDRIDANDLTIRGGTVHTLCGFEVTSPIRLTDGKLFVQQGQEKSTTIRGDLNSDGTGGTGTVQVERGTVKLYGQLSQLDIIGGSKHEISSHVSLYGTVDTVNETGACTLTVGSEGVAVGMVTGTVKGIAGSGALPVLSVGSDSVNGTPRMLETEGEFARISGNISVRNKVTIQDASSITEAKGTGGTLIIKKVNDTMTAPVLTGTFTKLDISDTTIALKNSVAITDVMMLTNTKMTGTGSGVTLGAANKKLSCTMTNSTLSLVGVTAYMTTEGKSGASLYVDETTHGYNSAVGIQGSFDAVTGHVHTCGDVVVLSTVDDGTFGQDKAIIVGGTPLATEATSGKDWGLTLMDTKGSTIVELDSRKDQNAAAATGTFQYIKVIDNAANTNQNISLTMCPGAQPVTLKNATSQITDGDYGLSAIGDASTVITLNTHEISGYQSGVTLDNVTASLTGATPETAITGTMADAIVATNATLNLADYTVTGAKNGITLKGDPGSNLNLKGSITLTCTENGLNVLHGSLTNQDLDVPGTFYGSGSITSTGANGAALAVTDGTVILKNYDFTASGTSGKGVWTKSGTASAVALSADENGGKTIHGYQTGVELASGTTLTLTNYKVVGGTATVQANANQTNTTGGAISGQLQLAGTNSFLGGACGLDVKQGGSVTNYQLANGQWTLDEKAIGAAPVGSGSILAGSASGAKAVSTAGTLTLGDYKLSSTGAYGLYVSGGKVYLLGGTANNTVSAAGGEGVYLTAGTATVEQMLLSTAKTDGPVSTVQNGVLNLGAGVTLGGTGRQTVVGGGSAATELHVASGNKAISAEGKFSSLTGYVKTTGDLTVLTTEKDPRYSAAYATGAEILGGGTTHKLVLGGEKINASLAPDGAFASIRVTGTDKMQQKLGIVGGLTVANSNETYALSATYADITMAVSETATPYTRSFTASGTNSTAVNAETGSKLYLSDTVTMTGGQKGLNLMGNALVTNQKKADGSNCTTYEEGLTGTTAGSGSITGTSGVAVTATNHAVLLLGDYGIKGGTRAVEVSGDASALLKTAEVKTITVTTGNTVSIDTTGSVLLQNYSMTNPNAAPIKVTSGTVTVLGNGVTVPPNGTEGVTISGGDVQRALVVTAVSPKKSEVTLGGRVKMVSGIQLTDGKVTVADADIESIAKGTGDGIAIEQKSGNVIIQAGTITGTAAALQQEAGNAWMSGGTLAGPVALKTNLWMTGGSISGTVTGTNAKLHMGIAVTQPVNVAGSFASLTGTATAAGALTIATTTDAGNALDGDAFVDTTANHHLVLTGADTAPGHTLTLTTGTVDLSGHFAKTTLKSGTVVTVIEDGAMADTSTVEAGSSLTVNADKTLTIGEGTGTLNVAGDLVVNGSVIGNLNVTGTTTVHGNVTGDIQNSGVVNITGAVSGIVTGTAATLTVNSTTGTDVDVTGTFKNLETGDKNTVTMTGALTVNGTGTAPASAHVVDKIGDLLTVKGGIVHVDATGADGTTGAKLKVETAGAAFVKGKFAAMNGTVTLEGATEIASGTSTVNAGSVAHALTVKGNAVITANTGIYGDVTVQNTAKLTGKGGTYGKLVLSDSATVDVKADTTIATASSVGRGSKLTVDADKTLTIGTKGTMTVAGTLTVKGAVIGNLNVSGTAAISGTVTGDIQNSGVVNITGAVSGIVTGTAPAQLKVNTVAPGTDVKVQGKFAKLETTDKNTVTMAGPLTITDTTGTAFVHATADALVIDGGAVKVNGEALTTQGANLTVNGGTATIQGNFASAAGSVTLYGNTTIGGAGNTVVLGTQGPNELKLTLTGSGNVTLNQGKFGSLTVTGKPKLTLVKGSYTSIASQDFTAMSGALTVTGPVTAKNVELGTNWKSETLSATAASLTSGTVEGKQMDIGTLTVGNAKKATLNTKEISYLTGTLTVAADKITVFPAASAYGTYQGWYLDGGNGTLVSKAAYKITGNEILRAAFRLPDDGEPPKYDITPPAPLPKPEPGMDPELQQTRHGEIILEKQKEASNKTVVVRAKPEASYQLGTVTVLDKKGNSVPVIFHPDGRVSFDMPASPVTIQAEFVPILGQPQETASPWYSIKSKQQFYLNGKAISVNAYNINYNNYVKLRDIASLLGGTQNQFSVDYNRATQAINLQTGKAYVPVGGENAVTADYSAGSQISHWTLEVNGVKRYLKCYTIGGNNYFQLRELGLLMGFGVEYNEGSGAVTLTTK